MILPVLLLSSLCAALASFAGRWTDAGDGGYGGEFFVCEDAATGVAQGFYSETGYARGVVIEANGVRTWSGYWYEPGADDNLENWGGFAMQLAADGQSFNGTWTFASRPGETHVWADARLSDEAPTLRQCMATNAQGVVAQLTNDARAKTGFTLEGSWLGEGTINWHTCIGEGGRFVSSYKYETGGEVLRGYIRGEQKLDGQLLIGDYWEGEAGSDHGLFMIALLNNREMMYTYWAVDSLLDIDIGQIGDEFIHKVDFTRRVSTEVSFRDCNRYSALADGGAVNDDDDDDDGFDGIDTPSGTVIALSVLFALFTTATVAGGGYYVWGNHERRRKQARRNSRANN